MSALPYFLCPFPSPYRAGIPGRLVPVGSDCASRRGVVSRGSAHPWSEKQVRVGSGVWPGLLVGEAVRRRVGDQSEHSGRRGGPESEAGAVSPRPGLPVGNWIVLLACCLGIWAGPRVCALVRNVVCWVEPLLGSRSMRDPGFMNPTHAIEVCYKQDQIQLNIGENYHDQTRQ